MARSDSSKNIHTISRSIYLSPELDGAISRYAEANGLDHAKATRLLMQKGLDAPVVGDFALEVLTKVAQERGLTVPTLIGEVLARFALENIHVLQKGAPAKPTKK